MARGYPDYFGQGIFPKYGGARRIAGSKTVNAGNTETLFTVSGKGIIYGGEMFINNTPGHHSDVFTLYVDSVLIYVAQPDVLYANGYLSGVGIPVYITKYDRFTGDFYIVVSGGITFDEEVKVTLKNNGANSVIGEYRLYYTLIK